MAYLIHFNRNHSPKNGQFTSGDGDGDGIANDHKYQKNSWAVRKGYQNKDGTLTKLGQRNLDAARQNEKNLKRTSSEAKKLMKKNKELHDIYEGTYDKIDDDLDYFNDYAKDRGLNTSAYSKAKKISDDFKNNNYSYIKNGEQMMKRMYDLNSNPATWTKIKKNEKEMYKARLKTAAVLGLPISTLYNTGKLISTTSQLKKTTKLSTPKTKSQLAKSVLNTGTPLDSKYKSTPVFDERNHPKKNGTYNI